CRAQAWSRFYAPDPAAGIAGQLGLGPGCRQGARGRSRRGRTGVRRRGTGPGAGRDPPDPPPRRPLRRGPGAAGALARRPGGRPRRPPHPVRQRACRGRRPAAAGRPCDPRDRRSRPYPQPHRLPGRGGAVLRRHPVQPRLRADVRGRSGADARIAAAPGRPPGRHPGLLRPRIHAFQCRFRPGGGTGQPCAGTTPGRGHCAAPGRPAHGPGRPADRTGHQSLPALRGTCRPRGRRAPPGTRPAQRRGLFRRTARLEGRVRRMRRAWPVALVAFSCVAFAQEAPSPAPGPQAAPIDGDIPGESADAPPSAPTGAETGEAEAAAMPEGMRSGRDIYQAFRDGLAEPACGSGTTRYEQHFRHAPARLADPDSDVLPLFGHVVDALRQAHLPTEYALIPFVESGYAPGARSASGPAGLWQFVSHTARHHGVPVHKDYDGRLSPAESTRAAVEYLRKLNGMLGGNWRLTAMAYNAGESRVLQALRRSGNVAHEAMPGSLQGLSPITYADVDKLHALACVLSRAGDEPEWMDRLDRPVLALEARQLEGASKLDTWALGNGQDAAVL